MPQFQGKYVAENARSYIIETSLKATPMAMSGSLAPTPMPVDEGFINVVPFWGDLSGEFSDNVSGGSLTFGDIDASSMAAPIINVEKGWKQEGIVDAVTMGDQTVITQMVSRVSNWTNREVNRIAIQVALAGTIGANIDDPDMDAGEYQTVLDLSNSGQALAHTDFIDAVGLFGERMDEVSTVWCHPKVHTHLEKLDLVSNVSAYSSAYPGMGQLQGKTVLLDNSMKPAVVTDGDGLDLEVYPIILGAGQFAQYGDGSVARKMAHVYYDDTTDTDRLSTRQRMSFACFGCNFTPVAANTSPLLAEIQDPANWSSGFLGVDMGEYPFRSAVILAALRDFTPVVPAP